MNSYSIRLTNLFLFLFFCLILHRFDALNARENKGGVTYSMDEFKKSKFEELNLQFFPNKKNDNDTEISSEELTDISSEKINYKRVFLASYPRSGNHWVRFLIEEATHIATSSLYKDGTKEGNVEYPHMHEPFPWGGYCVEHGYEGDCRYPNEDETIVIKSHYPLFENKNKSGALKPYEHTIRVVRHPIDAFYSNYVLGNLFSKKHSQEEIAASTSFDFFELKRQIDRWKRFQLYWNEQHSVVTIRYEDIFLEPHYYLRLILDLIQYQATDADIERAILKYPPKGEFMKHIRHYSQENLKLIDDELGPLMQQFNYTIDGVGL